MAYGKNLSTVDNSDPSNESILVDLTGPTKHLIIQPKQHL
jgi:hypothetical protein